MNRLTAMALLVLVVAAACADSTDDVASPPSTEDGGTSLPPSDTGVDTGTDEARMRRLRSLPVRTMVGLEPLPDGRAWGLDVFKVTGIAMEQRGRCLGDDVDVRRQFPGDVTPSAIRSRRLEDPLASAPRSPNLPVVLRAIASNGDGSFMAVGATPPFYTDTCYRGRVARQRRYGLGGYPPPSVASVAAILHEERRGSPGARRPGEPLPA